MIKSVLVRKNLNARSAW